MTEFELATLITERVRDAGGRALFVGGWATSQLWLFWVAPIVGAALAGMVYKFISPEKE